MKEKIFNIAMHKFSNGGYMSTSMQQIAEACGMSKASLYKYFVSKQDLMLQVIDYHLEKMFERAEQINRDPELTREEKLKAKIILELNAKKESRAFVNSLLRALPATENAEVAHLFRRTRAALLNWHRESLVAAYGEATQPYLWDLVVLFQGTLREYVMLMSDDHMPLSAEHVADLIVANIETLIAHPPKTGIVLEQKLMKEYESFNLHEKKKTTAEQVSNLQADIHKKVKAAVPASQRAETEDALAALDNEIAAEKPRGYLLESLGLYLSRIVSLEYELKTLHTLLRQKTG